MTPEDWDAFYADLNAACLTLEAEDAVLSAHDDGLLAATLSPRTNPEQPLFARIERVARAVDVVKRAGKRVSVALTVEELCPGGLDPTDGVIIARELVDAGAALILAQGGTRALPALWARPNPTGGDLGDAFLASAAWLVGRVLVPVLALGPTTDLPRAGARAAARGLAGVVGVCYTHDG